MRQRDSAEALCLQEGAERDKLWIELKSFMIETEEAEDAAPAGGAASS